MCIRDRHVLDTTLDAPVLSGSGMEMTAEKTAYLQNHIEKLLASDEIRQCRQTLGQQAAFRPGRQTVQHLSLIHILGRSALLPTK